MAALSSASNAIGIIGLADCVFKNGRELYDFLYKAYKSDPQAKGLLKEIKDLEEVIVSIIAFVTISSDYRTSFSDNYAQSVHNILRTCEADIAILKHAAEASIGQQSDSWIAQITRSFKWASKEKDVLDARQRLGGNKSSLLLILQLCGAETSSNTLKQTRTLRTDVSLLQDVTVTGIQNIQKTLEDQSTTSGKMMDVLKTTVNVLHQETAENLRTLLQNGHQSEEQTHAILKRMESSIGTTNSVCEQGLEKLFKEFLPIAQSTTRRVPRVDRRQRQMLQHQSYVAANLHEELQQINKSISSIIIQDTVNSGITMKGSNIASMVLPLLLVRPQLHTILQTLVCEERVAVSLSEAQWLRSEFEHLLLLGHEVNIAEGRTDPITIKTKTKSLSTSHASAVLNSRIAKKPKKSRTRVAMPSFNTDELLDSGRRAMEKRMNRRTYDTECGQLVVWYNVLYPKDGNFKPFEFLFEFRPRPGICSTGFDISLSHEWLMGLPPRISRNLRTWNIVGPDSAIFKCAVAKDLEGIERLIASGEASALDRTVEGDSIFSIITDFYCERPDLDKPVMKALLRATGHEERVSFLDETLRSWIKDCCQGFCTTFKSIVSNPELDFDDDCVLESAMTAATFGFHNPDYYIDGNMEDCMKIEYKKGLQFFIELGFDVNARHIPSIPPPLLDMVSWDNAWWLTQGLLEMGADVAVVDSIGQSALHLCLRADEGEDDIIHALTIDNFFREGITSQLKTLLLAGCNPNSKTHYGTSVSHYARNLYEGYHWASWECALDEAGYAVLVDDMHFSGHELVRPDGIRESDEDDKVYGREMKFEEGVLERGGTMVVVKQDQIHELWKPSMRARDMTKQWMNTRGIGNLYFLDTAGLQEIEQLVLQV